MLRITVKDSQGGTDLVLEGQLSGPWVSEAERCWKSLLAGQHRTIGTVDVRGVISIDQAGKALLEQMYRQGAYLVPSGCLMNSVVEDIEQAARVRRRGDSSASRRRGAK